ncbi:MAG: MBOAT family protein [Magnetococcales bacterium]|nr:MBOAT family protein [Magnetococcales bacterium]
MLFNSLPFLLLFLPLTLTGYYLLWRRGGQRAAFLWLAVLSVLFYGYSDPWYIVLILFSMGSNYLVEQRLLATHGGARRAWFWVGLAANLGLLGYYKYANFFLDNINAVLDTGWRLPEILLPIGISFYIFQQITLLVDTYVERPRTGHGFLSHVLFVAFFPQLIAGPIVHHKEMMPQFERSPGAQFWFNLAVGLSLFAIGLAKKVLIADTMAQSVTPVFAAAATGDYQPHLLESWGALLCYSMQLYFDFSGYSDMAVGLAHLFGIRLPINFASPYQARSIIEFWSRWHVTFSRLIMDYVYGPLGLHAMRKAIFGGLKGWRYFLVAVAMPVMITILAAGFWHGAGWNFILFGAIHAVAITLNHAWRRLKRPLAPAPAWLLTFGLVTLGWIAFRADNHQAMVALFKGVVGLNGIAVPVWLLVDLQTVLPGPTAWLGLMAGGPGGVKVDHLLYGVPLLLAAVLWLPNNYRILARFQPGLASRGYPATAIPVPDSARAWHWAPTWPWALGTAALLAWSMLNLNRASEFIYFHF